jgi:hypothetical protein
MPFVVTKTNAGTASMGTGDFPTLHKNVYKGQNTVPQVPPYYNDQPVTVASYVTENWDHYIRHGSGSKPDTIVGSTTLTNLTEEWKKLYDEEKKKKQSDATARGAAHTKLKNRINDTEDRIGKLFDKMAQTRKVTSYGFIQMMYITAADNRFLRNPLGRYEATGPQYLDQSDIHIFPEKLNEETFLMPRYCDLLLKKLNFMFTGPIPTSQWNTTKDSIAYSGFEAIWKTALQSYNPGEKDYGKKVLSNANAFLPSNR